MFVTETAMAAGNPPYLVGKASKDLKLELDSSPGNNRNKVLNAWSKFFGVSFNDNCHN